MAPNRVWNEEVDESDIPQLYENQRQDVHWETYLKVHLQVEKLISREAER